MLSHVSGVVLIQRCLFAVFDNTPVDSFLEHLKSQHPNMKFTIEEGTTSLPFLDTEIE